MTKVKFYEKGKTWDVAEFEYASFDGRVLKGPLFFTCLPMTPLDKRDASYFYKAPLECRRGSIRFVKRKGYSEFIITDDWDIEYILEVRNRNYQLIEKIKSGIRSGGYPCFF